MSTYSTAAPTINPALYDTDMGDQSLDVSAANRKFQTSIIIKQDATKSGILSILEKTEEQSTPMPTRQPPPTMRPTAPQGGY